jgi:sporulation-control protein spo0M
MGFFSNIKNKLGIGGVKVDLQCPGQVAKADGAVSGKVVLTTKSDQEVASGKVKVIEVYTTGRGDDKKEKTYTLGEVSLAGGFMLKTGETKELSFTVPFKILKSDSDELKEKGGALGAIGKLGAFANAEKSEYFVEAEVDVKAAALDPSDKKPIKLV